MAECGSSDGHDLPGSATVFTKSGCEKSNRLLIYMVEEQMIQTEHDERRKRKLMTQQEVAEIAGCSVGRLQYHVNHGLLERPKGRLRSRYYYTEAQAAAIAKYFESRNGWERVNRG
jgi:hypothetical protein